MLSHEWIQKDFKRKMEELRELERKIKLEKGITEEEVEKAVKIIKEVRKVRDKKKNREGIFGHIVWNFLVIDSIAYIIKEIIRWVR